MNSEDSTNMNAILRMNRRTFVKMGVATGAIAFGGTLNALGQLPPLTACGIQEVFPTSPFIVEPFRPDNLLPVPLTMAPGWKPDPTLPSPQVPWTVRKSPLGLTQSPPSPELSRQDSYGFLPERTEVMPDGTIETLPEHAGTHQVWPTPAGQNFGRLNNWPAAGVPPILYHIRMQLGTHSFTSSPVRPIDSGGRAVTPPPGAPVTLDANGLTTLPDSVIYGFNGAFPGALINVEYGKPALVRFENDLDENPLGLDRQNFGAPDFAFLSHLHNGHSAPESDGNPHYMQINHGGYTPGDWVDNLYLNYPAGGDPSEIQSFLWFHDHRMHHTGANVYKGMVGLMPHYDTGIPADAGGIVLGTGLDTGNESDPAPNLGLPGVRVNNLNPDGTPDGTFNVKYDIPLALYDCALDDGVTPHADMHTDPAVCGNTHPEWWGKTFFKHFPNHGFVGDIFTVNCKAFPVLHVEPRRYRFRFLGASVARIYELALMTSAASPQPRPGTQGQWQIPDGVQWNNEPWTLIASMGGLLPKAVNTNTVHIWPATRREVVVDFTNADPNVPIYLTNLLVMVDGRKPAFNDPRTPLANLKYKVPLVKIVVDLPLAGPDQSRTIPELLALPELRPMPKTPPGIPGLEPGVTPTLAGTTALPHKEFVLTRGGPGDEEQWVINALPFLPLVPLTTVVLDKPEVWTNKNGGGGWVHPMHMHMEEHTTLARIGSTLPAHPEDAGKEDVNNLEPSESVTFYRNFRTFTGRYVAHCHNLAHEDHNMMFGWSILAAAPVGAFAVSGTVTNRNGRPLKDVTITINGGTVTNLTAVTDRLGNFSFPGLADGIYIVTPTRGNLVFTPLLTTVTIAGADVTGINFQRV